MFPPWFHFKLAQFFAKANFKQTKASYERFCLISTTNSKAGETLKRKLAYVNPILQSFSDQNDTNLIFEHNFGKYTIDLVPFHDETTAENVGTTIPLTAIKGHLVTFDQKRKLRVKLNDTFIINIISLSS